MTAGSNRQVVLNYSAERIVVEGIEEIGSITQPYVRLRGFVPRFVCNLTRAQLIHSD